MSSSGVTITTDGSTASTYNATTSYAEQVAATLLGSSYAAYIAQYEWARPVGTISQIPDAEDAVALEVAVLTDPQRILAHKTGIAGQMNSQSGGPVFTDLADRIADVTIETTAQGASTFTLSLIDPTLALLNKRDDAGNTFISADQIGHLEPPIDINFPPGTDCVWRLCQVRADKDVSGPNLTLTFEDAIVSELRTVDYSVGGVGQGLPDETLKGFISRMIQSANRYLGQLPGAAYVPIKYVPLVSPLDPNWAPPAVPSSAANPQSPLSRQNPTKTKQGLTAAQRAATERLTDPWKGTAKETSILETEAAISGNPVFSPLQLASPLR